MATRKMIHYTTLSSNSKATLQNGNLNKMLAQLNKLQLLHINGSAKIKGALHRHMIAMKQHINQHIKQLSHILSSLEDAMPGASFMQGDNDFKPQNMNNDMEREDSFHVSVNSDRDTLNKRWMRYKKMQQVNTRKKSRAVNSLNQKIYEYYYNKLSKLTKMTVDPVNCSYMNRAKARSAGFSPEHITLSYEQRFRILLYKVKIKWKPRDYFQRKWDYRSLFTRLCTNIMDCISQCTSPTKGHRLDSMERLDKLFKILRKFKISSPTIKRKRIYRGGGPKKCMKANVPKSSEEFEYCGKRNAIGTEQLAVPVVNSLSEVLQKQFKMEYGLQDVRDLYRASRISGPVSQRLKRFDLKSVPIGLHTVQIHFCHDHYVTSEQKPSGIVVWDSIQTNEDFKTELYSQLRLTYDMLSEYSDTAKGLVKYKNDSNNMQEDYTSCGIFAVLRAYFILTNKTYKINTAIARAYLENALEKSLFMNYDIFSCSYSKSCHKMEAMMENYINSQEKMRSTKVGKTASTSMDRALTDSTSGNVRDRRKQQRGNKIPNQLQSKNIGRLSSQSLETAQDPPNFTSSTIKKRGRPAKYSPEEKKRKIKENKLKSYHKTKASSTGIKRGRPAKYSPEEKELKVKENRLKSYHKTKGSKSINQKDKHSNQMKLLRLKEKYREVERQIDKTAHKNRRDSIEYREAERQRERETREQRRRDNTYRQVCASVTICMVRPLYWLSHFFS